jgi:hypothetical protein
VFVIFVTVGFIVIKFSFSKSEWPAFNKNSHR